MRQFNVDFSAIQYGESRGDHSVATNGMAVTSHRPSDLNDRDQVIATVLSASNAQFHFEPIEGLHVTEPLATEKVDVAIRDLTDQGNEIHVSTEPEIQLFI